MSLISFIAIATGYFAALLFVMLVAAPIGLVYRERLHIASFQRWLQRSRVRKWIFYYLVAISISVPLFATHIVQTPATTATMAIFIFLVCKFLSGGYGKADDENLKIITSSSYALRILLSISMVFGIVFEILALFPSIKVIILLFAILILANKYIRNDQIIQLRQRASRTLSE